MRNSIAILSTFLVALLIILAFVLSTISAKALAKCSDESGNCKALNAQSNYLRQSQLAAPTPPGFVDYGGGSVPQIRAVADYAAEAEGWAKFAGTKAPPPTPTLGSRLISGLSNIFSNIFKSGAAYIGLVNELILLEPNPQRSCGPLYRQDCIDANKSDGLDRFGRPINGSGVTLDAFGKPVSAIKATEDVPTKVQATPAPAPAAGQTPDPVPVPVVLPSTPESRAQLWDLMSKMKEGDMNPQQKQMWNAALAGCKIDQGNDCYKSQNRDYFIYNLDPEEVARQPLPGAHARTARPIAPQPALREKPTGDSDARKPLDADEFQRVGNSCSAENDSYNSMMQCMRDTINLLQGGLTSSDAVRIQDYIQFQSNVSPELRALCPKGDAKCIAEETTMLEDQTAYPDALKQQDERIRAKNDADYARLLDSRCKGDPKCIESGEDEGFGWAFPNAATEAARLRESQKALESGMVPAGYWDPNGPYPRGAEDMYVSPQDTPRNFTQGSFLSDVSKFFSNLFGGTNEKSLEPLYNSKQGYPGNLYKGTPLDVYKAYGDDEYGPNVDAWAQEEAQRRQDAAKAAETEAWLKELETRPQIVPSDFDEYINTEPTGSTQQIFDSSDSYPDEIPDESYIGPSRQYSVAVPFSNELFNQSLAASAFGAFLFKDKKDNIPARGAREPYGHGL